MFFVLYRLMAFGEMPPDWGAFGGLRDFGEKPEAPEAT